ncbi:hypothetical protein ACJIZ3_002512 [Penstemon smallii]|uniref:Uncharacterized protein n=1 Tax=Penstemon smallii TaxID=265156 RepID=A0ABD3U6L2_9LAMI
MYSNSSKLNSFPSLHKSTTCPATSPSDPTAEPISAIARTILLADTFSVSAATCSKERDNKESPARIAVASSKALWLVGFPLRKSSLSIQGRSSWISDMVSQAARQSMGRTRFPPARREYLIASWIFIGFCNGIASSRALFTFFAFDFMYSLKLKVGWVKDISGLVINSDF